MKYIKLTVVTLALTLVVCGVSVFATDNKVSYDQIELKSFSRETQKGPAVKQQTGAQSYRNFGTVDNCTANDKDVSVRVYSEANGYSSWMTVSPGATSSWTVNDATKYPNAYDLYIKVSSWSACSATHFGDWYLDRNI